MKSVTVVKLGGSLLDDAGLRATALEAIVARWNSGDDIVLVHGGGKHIDAALAKAGIPKRTHAGLRITDDQTLPIVVSTLAGMVNKMLVSELAHLGVRAAGIAGCDGATLVATKHPPIDGIDLGHVGQVTKASRGLISSLLVQGMLPVVSSIAIGEDGALFNINADSAAAAISGALAAGELIFLTDVEGLLDESGSVIPAADAGRVRQLIASGVVSGGMRPKLEAALTALHGGVGRVSIGTPATEGGTALVAA